MALLLPSSVERKLVDSQAEAAKILGVKPSVIKLAKKQGAPGFRNGKVHHHELKGWLDEHLHEIDEVGSSLVGKTDLEIRKLEAECERIELQNRVTNGQYVDREEMRAEMVKCFAAIRTDIEAIELLAPQVAGLSIPETAKRLREGCKEILQHLSEGSWKRHFK